MHHDPTLMIISAVGILMIIATATLFLSKVSRISFTILLVLVGYAVDRLANLGPSYLQPIVDFNIQPDIILYACLPTLIFESAFTLDSRLLKHNILPVLTLAIPGLFLSTLIIGGIVHLITGMEFLTALLLGAILSATDPVAVISLFKQLGVPKRLTILVEGESLFNDSTAIVTAKTILFIILAGHISNQTILHGAYEFCVEFFGGIVFGYIITKIIGWCIAFIHDEPIAELSLTLILAYGSFIIADRILHVSGVMATITAGIMMADWGRTKLSPETHHQLHTLLTFLAYITNSLIFLLVGFSIDLPLLYHSAGTLMIVIIAMLLSRAMVIYGLIPLISKFPSAEPINIRYQTVMWWGGLRGAIALAIVLGLTLDSQKELTALVMGAVLFTILVQGLSINKLIQWLKLDIPLLSDRVARIEARLLAEKTALERIPDLQRGGLFSLKIAENLQQAGQYALKTSKAQLAALRRQELDADEERKILYLSCFTAEKFLYFDMFSKGNLNENTYNSLIQDMNFKIDAMRYQGKLLGTRSRNLFSMLKNWFIHTFIHAPVLHHLINHIRLQDTIVDYEFKWAAHQGCISVLLHLNDIAEVESIDKTIVNDVRQQFERWKHETQQFLDDVMAQFPEFVSDAQQRLAERLLINAREEAITEQVHHGLLAEGDAQHIIESYHEKIHALRRLRKRTLVLDIHELIRKVPFFADIPENGAEEILQRLKEYRTSDNEVVIRQGAEECELYLIMRGVVRVILEDNGQTTAIATLMAGDFFGEMAMLEGIKRTATCKTVTPCVLYVLTRQDFEDICRRFPTIKEALMQEAEKRHQRNKD